MFVDNIVDMAGGIVGGVMCLLGDGVDGTVGIVECIDQIINRIVQTGTVGIRLGLCSGSAQECI